jgi:RNA recognition motif-containing protein
MNIYISNLSFTILDKDLRGFFSEYGEVSSAKIIMDRATMRSRGFGFVEMPDEQASKKAIAGLDGTTRDGRTIQVTEARPKKETPAYTDRSEDSYNNSTSFNKNQY